MNRRNRTTTEVNVNNSTKRSRTEHKNSGQDYVQLLKKIEEKIITKTDSIARLIQIWHRDEEHKEKL